MKRQQCPTEENAQEVDSNTHVRAHWLYRYTGKKFWPFIQLARWDLPIGWLLLMWPCWWTCLIAANVKLHSTRVFLAPGETVEQCVAGYNIVLQALTYLFLFFVGSVAMRGAGCTWNDLVDHKIDAKVERTKIRCCMPTLERRLPASNSAHGPSSCSCTSVGSLPPLVGWQPLSEYSSRSPPPETK